jgi:hypothetical protein
VCAALFFEQANVIYTLFLLAKKFLEEPVFVAWFRSPDCNAYSPGVFPALYAKPKKSNGLHKPLKKRPFCLK